MTEKLTPEEDFINYIFLTYLNTASYPKFSMSHGWLMSHGITELDNRAKEVVEKYFGLNGKKQMRKKDIGKETYNIHKGEPGISETMVSKIIGQSIDRIICKWNRKLKSEVL
ncbi:MAG TPA: hypothetical protein VMX17_01900 [Candidatus Glassbacteria bacterium]|nr:hypothetical protein [Candidatus Glassbacteria bacterium]